MESFDQGAVMNYTSTVLEPQQTSMTQYQLKIVNVMQIFVFVTSWLHLPINIFAAIILFNYRIQKDYGFFGTQLGFLIIGEIICVLGMQSMHFFQMFSNALSMLQYALLNITIVVQWTFQGVINWTMALICATKCMVEVDNRTFNSLECKSSKICFYISICVVAAISLALALCFSFNVHYSASLLTITIFINLLPLVVILITAGFVKHKISTNNRPDTQQNKIMFILAVIFSLVMFLISITQVLDLLMYGVISANLFAITSILRSIAYACEGFSFIFVLCSVSKLYRNEALAFLKCKPEVDSQNEELPMTHV